MTSPTDFESLCFAHLSGWSLLVTLQDRCTIVASAKYILNMLASTEDLLNGSVKQITQQVRLLGLSKWTKINIFSFCCFFISHSNANAIFGQKTWDYFEKNFRNWRFSACTEQTGVLGEWRLLSLLCTCPLLCVMHMRQKPQQHWRPVFLHLVSSAWNRIWLSLWPFHSGCMLERFWINYRGERKKKKKVL